MHCIFYRWENSCDARLVSSDTKWWRFTGVQNLNFGKIKNVNTMICQEKMETAERERERERGVVKQKNKSMRRENEVPPSKCSHPGGLADSPAASLSDEQQTQVCWKQGCWVSILSAVLNYWPNCIGSSESWKLKYWQMKRFPQISDA